MQKASLGLNARYKVLYNIPENLFIIHRFIEKKKTSSKKRLKHFQQNFCRIQTL